MAPPDRIAFSTAPFDTRQPWKIFARRGPRHGKRVKPVTEEVTYFVGKADEGAEEEDCGNTER